MSRLPITKTPKVYVGGAFIRSAPTLWTTDWTVMSIGGLLAD